MAVDKNHDGNFVFDLIAPIYGLFYDYQKRHYHAILDAVQRELELSKYHQIIDVGCGTGALCSVLQERGLAVTGVDPARKMLNIAMKKQANQQAIQFVQASAQSLPFADKSFDVAITSYVAHGLKEHERKIMYAEMSRITKDLVIIYDYNQNRALHTNIVEWLEGGDYFNFIRRVKPELQASFRELQVIDVDQRAALYICKPY